jgi:Carboxypeptidase regulatory-like domain
MTVYPVTGKVLQADGKPLPTGRVTFVAVKDALTSSATIGNDGGFTVKGSIGDGLPAGEYKVRIEIDESALPTVKGKITRTAPLPFPDKYTDEDTSGLTATVRAGEPNNFTFNLTREARPTQSRRAR